jgi:signal transduction histidine kinase
MQQKQAANAGRLRLSVRLKLLLPFFLLIVIVIILAFPVNSLILSRLEEEADNRLERNAIAFQQLLEETEQQIEPILYFIINLPEVETIGRDRALAGEILGPQREALGLQELSYYRSDYRSGMPTLYYNGPEVDRQNITNERSLEIRDGLILRAIEEGQPVSGISIAPQGSQIIGAAPIYLDGQLNGIVVAVIFINNSFVDEIGDILGIDVALVRDNGIIVSTIDRSSGYELILQQGFLDTPEASMNISYAGDNIPRRMHAHTIIIDGVEQGDVLVVRTLQDVIAVQERIQIVIVIFLGLITVIMVFYSVGVIVNFANPLQRLASAAAMVSAGQLDERVPVPKILIEDEVVDLSRNFNTMTQRLSSFYSELESKVRQRSADLQDTLDELERKRDEALDANKTKSLFLANMSHELRTPLNAIIGYSEMLEEEAEDFGYGDIVPDLRKIQSAGTHLLALINDILDISKIEAGKIELYLEQFELENLIDEVAMTIQPIVEKKGNKLAIQIENELDNVYADMTRMRQILMNLLSNAAKFTENGTISITARRFLNSENIDWLEIAVKDSGIGMNEKQLSRIFNEFTQADASTTRKYGGTGLGLPISRHFTEMMGGKIIVSSVEGQGSTFMISMPARVKAPEKRATKEMPAIRTGD